MARPFEDHMPYQQMSQNSLASQTVLAGPEEYGSSWSAKRKLSTKRPKLPKIKSSSTAAHNALNDRISHKRGSSASADPTSPTYVPDYLIQTSSSFLPTAHANPLPSPKPTRNKSTKVKIKPLLSRTFSSQEKVHPQIDLSRSAADNEGLAAAISEVHIPGASVFASPKLPSRSGSISQPPRAGYHQRNPSVTSQDSSRYVHPLRPTPRAYTPPVAGSYKTSFDSDTNTSTPITSDLDTSTSTPYAPLPPSKQQSQQPRRNRTILPQLHTSSSKTNLTSTTTNNNQPPTPSSLRNPLPPTQSTTSPFPSIPTTARSSFDTVSTNPYKPRSRSNTAGTSTTTANDPPRTQAETVQHLRAKFAEKEARKDAKYAEKEARRRDRKDSDARRMSEKRERKLASASGKGSGWGSASGGGRGGRSRATSKAGSERSEATFGTRDRDVVVVGSYGAGGGGGGGGLGIGGIGGIGGMGIGGVGTGPKRVDQDALGAEMFGSDVQQLRKQSSRGDVGHVAPNHSNANAGSRFGGGGVGGGGGRSGAGTPKAMRSRAGTFGAGGGGNGGGVGGRAAGEKVEKVKGRWSLFWFRVRTVWLRAMRKFGRGG